ncbi:flagellar hook protein FlgE [Pseudomonas sp. WS 5018]|uniref:Flagellar hook protein FlgE n=1 Tax=Stutzerimonas stutzeri TaxID=316 RepID=A0AA40RQS8_STUST|nr:flagellar hook protein FlgE [Stutzerimonas stutzeri]MBA1304309.1 flagellar hook protein FlgE [Stutzerimonas stutzeri]MDH0154506.1 flagellar hook protein FlgE [Stutzerimonas stutzeri]NMY64761.1 flagellar hook protein FlgE [Pseudomonas sp. WS 5018]UUC84887.1 flagellar hook protein FlgE [Stutzerimonas stutzeri]
MSFNIGLSGLRAASKDLNVTGNNIANAGTVGFKQSRAEFSDVYAASVLGTGKNPQGSGVLMSNISQQFNQGNINYTQNALDLAINGNGFFQVSNNGAVSYTRAGYFGTDRSGFLVDNFGYKLQGFPVDGNGNLQNGVVGDLQIQTTNQAPKATSKIDTTFNLNSTQNSPTGGVFNPLDPTTYNSSTSLNIYDSQGNAHVMTQYFVKTGANTWDMKVLVDGRNPNDPQSTSEYNITLQFTPDGKLDIANIAPGGDLNFDPVTGQMTMNNWTPAVSSGGTWVENGATAVPITLDLTKSTQYASAFAVNSVAQDGYTTGELAGLEIDDTGVIFARYTNGQSKVQGQIILANFANVQGLTPVGKTQWVQSFESGEPVVGTPGSGTLGALQAGALEDSNVELSDQLVNLIVAQRNYQANAKTIETESAITQTIINLR